MPRRRGLPKERRHIHLSVGAWERLTELYSSQGVTPSSVIAQLVDFHLRKVDERINTKLALTQALDGAAVETLTEVSPDA